MSQIAHKIEGNMKAPQVGPYAAGNDSRINVALMRPTVNLKEAENVGEAAAAVAPHTNLAQPHRFSRHGTFGPIQITHPGIET